MTGNRLPAFVVGLACLLLTGGAAFAGTRQIDIHDSEPISAVVILVPDGDSAGYVWQSVDMTYVFSDNDGSIIIPADTAFIRMIGSDDLVFGLEGVGGTPTLFGGLGMMWTDAGFVNPVSNDGTIPGWVLGSDGLIYFADSSFFGGVLMGFLTDSYFWLVAWPAGALLLAAVWAVYRKVAETMDIWVPGDKRYSHVLSRPMPWVKK